MHQLFLEVFQNSAKLAKWLFPTPCAGQKKTTPLWSKIVKITNNGIKYTSCQLKIFQKTKLQVKISKISIKFDLCITWVKSDPSREHVFVYTK